MSPVPTDRACLHLARSVSLHLARASARCVRAVRGNRGASCNLELQSASRIGVEAIFTYSKWGVKKFFPATTQGRETAPRRRLEERRDRRARPARGGHWERPGPRYRAERADGTREGGGRGSSGGVLSVRISPARGPGSRRCHGDRYGAGRPRPPRRRRVPTGGPDSGLGLPSPVSGRARFAAHGLGSLSVSRGRGMPAV